jgi:hypothetical protein
MHLSVLRAALPSRVCVRTGLPPGVNHWKATLRSVEDEVNVALFHPRPGGGFVYGTKQGKVRAADFCRRRPRRSRRAATPRGSAAPTGTAAGPSGVSPDRRGVGWRALDDRSGAAGGDASADEQWSRSESEGDANGGDGKDRGGVGGGGGGVSPERMLLC